MSDHPPKWADWFLGWYCNPELLEEIQGDARRYCTMNVSNAEEANVLCYAPRYVWDVLRFCRWSNIKRTENGFVPGSTGALWSMNFKMALRNANKNKLIFAVKTFGLAICLAFALLLTAYVVNELTFDKFNINHDRIYRITSKVNFQDHVTHYAVTPLPIGQALVEDITEIENYFRFMYEEKPIFRVEEQLYYDQVALAAEQQFFQNSDFRFFAGEFTRLN